MAGDDTAELSGPDLAAEGVAHDALADGDVLLGHAAGEAVVLVRRGDEVFALGATCSHYGGPLAEGVFDGDCLRCPWHHAAFEARTGAAARPPALHPVTAYEVADRGGRWHVGDALPQEMPPSPAAPPDSVVIVGGGAAGYAAAQTLRREGYDGPITLVSADPDAPVDRPNLSKDYLAGTAPEEWIPLAGPEQYAELRVDLRLGVAVTDIDTRARTITTADGTQLPYGALLLAPGADPIPLDVPGADLPHVHYLRSLADSRAIIAAAEGAQRAVVVGASFIGLEVAASLRAREIAVQVVAPEPIPFEPILGPELGAFVRALHEEHGVEFRLEETVDAITDKTVRLRGGGELSADLVVIGIGVRPAVELAERSGLTVDNGIVVDAQLRSSDPAIWAAGDAARWPDPHSGDAIRVEHWAVAERQGQTAARNILGAAQPYDAVPFFWSQHYDVPINYCGHAANWDRTRIAGDVNGRDCLVGFERDGRVLAVASIYRDQDSLRAEMALERDDQDALRQLLAGD